MGGCSLEQGMNMLRRFDELLDARRDGPDYCAKDGPEQYAEDNVEDVEHGDGCLLSVNG